MAKKKKKTPQRWTLSRDALIARLVEDVTSWDLGNLLGFAREARENDLKSMTNTELLSEAEDAAMFQDQPTPPDVTGVDPAEETMALCDKIAEEADEAQNHAEDAVGGEARRAKVFEDALWYAWEALTPRQRKSVFFIKFRNKHNLIMLPKDLAD